MQQRTYKKKKKKRYNFERLASNIDAAPSLWLLVLVQSQSLSPFGSHCQGGDIVRSKSNVNPIVSDGSIHQQLVRAQKLYI